jgi:hypothetical protein
MAAFGVPVPAGLVPAAAPVSGISPSSSMGPEVPGNLITATILCFHQRSSVLHYQIFPLLHLLVQYSTCYHEHVFCELNGQLYTIIILRTRE